MSEFVILRGERCVRLDVVAEWYHVEVSFIAEAVELDLLELESTAELDVVLPEHQLDRLAQLLRWQWQTGLELAALALLLPPRSARGR